MVLGGAFGGDSGFRGESGFSGEEGFSGPLSRSWNGGLGEIDDGIINRVRNRVKAFRTHLAIWETRVNTARYNLSRKNTAGNRKKLARMIRERNAKLAQLNAETATLRQMEQELAAQQAAEQSAANAGGGAGPAAPSDSGGEMPAGGGGDGGEAASDDPSSGGETTTDGLGGV